MTVSDKDIDDINRSIVESMNELGAMDSFLEKYPDGGENTMAVMIKDKKRGYSGFCIRGNKAELVKTVQNPNVEFIVVSKEWYYLFIEDLLLNANVRSLLMTSIYSKYPRIEVNPPVEQAGSWHVEALLQIFETWQKNMLGDD
ncbi:MAG: hypothetical protein U9R15_08685 [Chloroflexota bacterium]|nr:hypothetical protein [Chloroflexota bacterium]